MSNKKTKKKPQVIKVTELTASTPKKTIIEGFARCGDCSGLNREALIKGIEAPCSDQGKLEKSKACPKFRPDVITLSEFMNEGFHDISSILNKMLKKAKDPASYRTLGLLMMQAADIAEAGLHYYDRIYIRYRGTATSNYLSNFMSAHVLSVAGNELRVISADPRNKKQFTMSFEVERDTKGRIILDEGSTVFSPRKFKKMRKEMEDRNRTVDPQLKRKTTKAIQNNEGYDLTDMPKASLDGFVVEMYDVAKTNKVKPYKKTKTPTLIDFVTGLETGEANWGGRKKRKQKNNGMRVTELGEL